jgi:hypothetical protein
VPLEEFLVRAMALAESEEFLNECLVLEVLKGDKGGPVILLNEFRDRAFGTDPEKQHSIAQAVRDHVLFEQFHPLPYREPDPLPSPTLSQAAGALLESGSRKRSLPVTLSDVSNGGSPKRSRNTETDDHDHGEPPLRRRSDRRTRFDRAQKGTPMASPIITLPPVISLWPSENDAAVDLADSSEDDVENEQEEVAKTVQNNGPNDTALSSVQGSPAKVSLLADSSKHRAIAEGAAKPLKKMEIAVYVLQQRGATSPATAMARKLCDMMVFPTLANLRVLNDKSATWQL